MCITEGKEHSLIKFIKETLGTRKNSLDDTIDNYKINIDTIQAIKDEDFINNFDLNKYWGTIYENGERSYGPVFEGSIRGYLNSHQKVPISALKSFDGISDIKINEENGIEYIDEMTVLGFKIDDSGNIKYKIFNEKMINSIALDKESEWQLGCPFMRNYELENLNIYESQLILTDEKGQFLNSRYAKLETGKVEIKDNSKKWISKEMLQDNILDRKNEKNAKEGYGYRIRFYRLIRTGNKYEISGHDLELTTIQFKYEDYSKTLKFFPDRFKDKTYESVNINFKREIENRAASSYFKEILPSQSVINEGKDFTNQIISMTQEQRDFRGGPNIIGTIDIDGNMIRKLNSKLKKGKLVDGPGKTELRYFIEYCIGKDKFEEIDYHKTIGGNLLFDYSKSDKEVFKIILDAIQKYKSPEGSELDEMLRWIDSATIIKMDEEIIRHQGTFFENGDLSKPRTFSEGDSLKEFGDYEDKKLVEDLHKALIDIMGRFSYTYWIEGKLIYRIENSNIKINFIKQTATQFQTSFITKDRLYIPHFREDFQTSPDKYQVDYSIYVILDNIIFGPTRRFDIFYEEHGIEDNFILNIPNLPTDYWGPLYQNEFEVISNSEEDEDINEKLLDYNIWLSRELAKQCNFRIQTPAKESEFKPNQPSKLEHSRDLLDQLYDKYKKSINSVSKDLITNEERIHYLYLAKLDLMKLFFLIGQNSFSHKQREKILDFLEQEGDIKKVIIELESLSSLPNEKMNLKTIILDETFYNELSTKRLIETYKSSFRKNFDDSGVAPELDTENILDNLKESISQFGNALRDLAEEFNKELYIIPLRSRIEGYGQPYQSSQPFNRYLKPADSIVQFGSSKSQYNCWILDGTSEQGIQDFSKEYYGDILRALIEGRNTFIICTKNNYGKPENVIFFNIEQGTIDFESIIFFYDKKTWRHMGGLISYISSNSIHLDSYDKNRENSIACAMQSFREHNVYYARQSTANSDAHIHFYKFKF